MLFRPCLSSRVLGAAFADSDFVHGLEGEGFFGSCGGRLGGGVPVDRFEHIVASRSAGKLFSRNCYGIYSPTDRPQILLYARSQRDHGGVHMPCPEGFHRLKDQEGELPWAEWLLKCAC